ncbi:MAG: hypothetical protein C0518_00945 [Opitutus sp.]|nr:hypothetical protein [Opitutus sp.]
MALAVARSCSPGRVIIHCNHCHLDPLVLKGGFQVFGQINDYENAELPGRWRDVIRHQGFRRGISLWLRRRREKSFVENQDVTVCNSEYTRRAVLDAYHPARARNVVTIHKAVDLEIYRPPTPLPDDPLARDRRRLQLLFVGTDFVRKGLDLLLAAMPQLCGVCELTVVGPTEKQVEQAFPRLVQASREAGTVRYAGRVEKETLRKILWRSTALVLPSRAEALGVALLEAAAAGLHVIGSRVGGIPEIIERLPGGVIIEPDSSAAIVRAVQAISENSMRPVFANSAVELFSKQRMLARLRKLYLSFPY